MTVWCMLGRVLRRRFEHDASGALGTGWRQVEIFGGVVRVLVRKEDIGERRAALLGHTAQFAIHQPQLIPLGLLRAAHAIGGS